jgi:hypothetical protein
MIALPPGNWSILSWSLPLQQPWLGGVKDIRALKFTDVQTAFISKQDVDGHPVAEICRKAPRWHEDGSKQ